MRARPVDGVGDAGAGSVRREDGPIVRPRAVAHATGLVGFGDVLRETRDGRTDDARERAERDDAERRDEEGADQRSDADGSRGDGEDGTRRGRRARRGRGGAGGGARGARIDGAIRYGVAGLPAPGSAASSIRAQRAQLDIGASAAAAMGAISPMAMETTAAPTLRGVLRAEARDAASGDARQHAQLVGESQVVVDAGRLTPRAALDRVVDEATRLAIEEASRELHIELEPADLGPIIVTLRRDGQALEVRLRAERAEAAAELARDLAGLEGRLRRLGYASARVRAEHDPHLHA